MLTLLSSAPTEADSRDSWIRLALSVVLAAIGGVGMWSVVVALPAIQAEFEVARGAASLPFAATMMGFAAGGVLMGRLADRFGIILPIMIAACGLGLGYLAIAASTSIWHVVAAQGILVGFFGCSATFGPLVSDISHWFLRRRGIAVAIVASGSYLAGAVWPPVVQSLIDSMGWREAHAIIGVVCFVTLLPLSLLLRRRSPVAEGEAPVSATRSAEGPGVSPQTLQTLLIVAGFACCAAMSMPQVHLVAYCGDLGYGVARGAEMLSLMLSMGIVSRLVSGLIADRVGGVPTLLIGSVLQALALAFYLPFDGLASLYIVSALFGLGQGGIVPSYAIIVREYFRPSEAGVRVGVVLMATIVGMAFGGWIAGVLYDLTGSYQIAFLNGIAWNLLNMAIALWLLIGSRRRTAPQAV